MHVDWLCGGFRFCGFQNAAATPVIGKLNEKKAILKIALLPPQRSELATANAERTQKNQRLIRKRKFA
jgi:hypothetical protein